MKRKLPAEEAFAYYVGLSAARSYEAVASHFEVTKKAVTNLATKDKWQERLTKIEEEARQKSDEKAAESISAMNERHLKVMKFVQSKAIETLKNQPIETAMDALKAYTLTLQTERLIRGEPSDRTALDIAATIKREYDRWLVRTDETGEGKAVQ